MIDSGKNAFHETVEKGFDMIERYIIFRILLEISHVGRRLKLNGCITVKHLSTMIGIIFKILKNGSPLSN